MEQVHPLFAAATSRYYAGQIEKAANGRWRSTSSQAGRTQQIEPERRVEKDGGFHVGKATQRFCQDRAQKASDQAIVVS